MALAVLAAAKCPCHFGVFFFEFQRDGREFCWVPSKLLQKAMENKKFLMGKLTISMAMFNSYVTNYQRV